VQNSEPGPPGFRGDQNLIQIVDPKWESAASSWLKVVPWGFRKLLKWVKDTYDNPLVYVTENGFSDDNSVGLNDTRRINYFRQYINYLLKAVKLDECNVMGYTAWYEIILHF